MPRYLLNNNSDKISLDREDGEMSEREASSESRSSSRSVSLHTKSDSVPPVASSPGLMKEEERKQSQSPVAHSHRDKSRSRSRSHKHRSKHSKKRSRSRSKSRSHRHRSRSRSHGRRYSPVERSYSRKEYGTRYDRNKASTSRSPPRHRRQYGDRTVAKKEKLQFEKENPRESRCLGVFGLSLYTEERQLRDIFGRYGPVEDLQIVYDYHTGRSRGFGFVYMKHIEDAVEAKEMIPGMEIDGHKIRVDFSVTDRPHTPTPGTYLGRGGGGGMGYRGTRRYSPSPYRRHGGRGRSRSYSRSRSFSPRRY